MSLRPAATSKPGAPSRLQHVLAVGYEKAQKTAFQPTEVGAPVQVRFATIGSVERFRAYVACCLYVDGFDYVINYAKNLEEIPDGQLIEELQIQEVTPRGIFMADLLAKANTSLDYTTLEAKMLEPWQRSTAYPDITKERLMELSYIVGLELRRAFDEFGFTLTFKTNLYTGVDADDSMYDDMMDTDDPEEGGVNEFEFETPFLSTSTQYAVAKDFSKSQMGMEVGGVVWKLAVSNGTRVLPLTSSLFGGPVVDPRWVTNADLLQEQEVLLSKELSNGKYTADIAKRRARA